MLSKHRNEFTENSWTLHVVDDYSILKNFDSDKEPNIPIVVVEY